MIWVQFFYIILWGNQLEIIQLVSTKSFVIMENCTNFVAVAQLWTAEKKQFVKRSTMAAYQLTLNNHLLPHFADCTDISETDVQQFVISQLDKGLSQKSIKDQLIVLKLIYRYGCKKQCFVLHEWDIHFPTEQQKRDICVLTIEQQKRLMCHLRDNFTFQNLGILLCLYTGIRIGEVCALRWSDIDIATGTLFVRHTIERIYCNDGMKNTELLISTPKTKNSLRDIPLCRDLLKLLKPLHRVVNPDYYILTNSPKPTEPRTYRNFYRHLLQTLNIPYIKFHGLRHSFATRCIESGCDYKTVSILLGHANISTTLNLYVHPNYDQKKRCIDTMLRHLR